MIPYRIANNLDDLWEVTPFGHFPGNEIGQVEVQRTSGWTASTSLEGSVASTVSFKINEYFHKI